MAVFKIEIQKKLSVLHEHENDHNKEMGAIDKQIKQLIVRKNKLRRFISKNVSYRNRLINGNE